MTSPAKPAPASGLREILEIARSYIIRSNNNWRSDDLEKVNAALAALPASDHDVAPDTVADASDDVSRVAKEYTEDWFRREGRGSLYEQFEKAITTALQAERRKREAADAECFALAAITCRTPISLENGDMGCGALAAAEVTIAELRAAVERAAEDERDRIVAVIRDIATRFERGSASQNNHRALADAIEDGRAFPPDRARARSKAKTG